MLVDTQKLVAPQQFHVNLVIFVRKPLVRMIKNTNLSHFQAFFIVLDHVNTCASMRLLVEIHNKPSI